MEANLKKNSEKPLNLPNSSLPKRVTIFEVGPRDGLQNESRTVPTAIKATFIEHLTKSGLRDIEITSFVHPKAIPQLADADELLKTLAQPSGVRFHALVPNQKGLERAVRAGIKNIAVFTAASETFVQKNIKMTIEESLREFQSVIQTANTHGMKVRGYISTGFVCPYEGNVPKEKVSQLSERLLEIGVTQVSIADTIGAAAPSDITETIGYVLKKISLDKIALHFHDTYGTALTNVYAALQLGITTFDTSAGGLGGCPYAPGAAGNLATEDLVYMLDRMDIETGVRLEKIFEASSLIARELKRDLPSRQWKRLSGSV